MLVGLDPQLGSDRVYIGEANDVFERLKTHDKDETKDFWTRAVTVTSKDFNLTKAHGRHLESRLIELAHDAKRAKVSNGNSPGLKTLPESEVGTLATAREIEGTFVVLKGSTARRQGSPSWDSYAALREERVAQGKLIVKTEELLEFAEDVEFISPSSSRHRGRDPV